MSSLTHIDAKGRVHMVDVTDKTSTQRSAVASGKVKMGAETLNKIQSRRVTKGNVFETARIAGIMAAKKTADLIPLCHPLNPTHIQIEFFPDPGEGIVRIEATVRLTGRTGVEMEALTAVAVAALTIYDMCKSYQKDMILSEIQLIEKSGGKSGHYVGSAGTKKDRP